MGGELGAAAAARLNAAAAAAAAWLALPSVPLALTLFALFVVLELLQRWAVLRPVRGARGWAAGEGRRREVSARRVR